MSHAPSPHSSRMSLLSPCCALRQRNARGSKIHCGPGGKVAIALCLLPWAIFRRLAGKALPRSGKHGMAGLLESAPESFLLLSRMWRPLRWAIVAPLVLAQRIHFRRGIVPGLLDACRRLRRAGPAAAVRVLDPRTGDELSPETWRPPLRLREALTAWHLAADDRGCLLLVDHDAEGSGAVACREEQGQDLTGEGRRVLLLGCARDGRWSLSCRPVAGDRPAELNGLEDMDELFRVIPVARVVINNIAFHPDPLSILAFFRDRKRRLDFALRYVCHDYLSLCPSPFLLNTGNVHCDVPSLQICRHCLPHNPNRIAEVTDIVTWRAEWLTFFLACDELICSSESSRAAICRVYPVASRLRVQKREPLAEFLEPFSPPVPGDCLQQALVGDFARRKDACPEGLLAARDDPMRREYDRPLVSFAEKAGEENAHPTAPCPARDGASALPPSHETPKKESGNGSCTNRH